MFEALPSSVQDELNIYKNELTNTKQILLARPDAHGGDLIIEIDSIVEYITNIADVSTLDTQQLITIHERITAVLHKAIDRINTARSTHANI